MKIVLAVLAVVFILRLALGIYAVETQIGAAEGEL